MSSLPNEGAYQAAFLKSRNKLVQATPDDIADRSRCRYDASAGCFEIPSFGQIFRVSYPDGIVKRKNSEKNVSLDWALVLLNYLSSSKGIPLAGQWVTYRELPSGQIFYANLKRYVLDELSAFYARCDKNILIAALEKSGCTKIQSHADLNLRIDFSPRVPVLLQFWDGEEDLPGSCQILFDQTAADQLHIEDVAVVCGILKRKIARI